MTIQRLNTVQNLSLYTYLEEPLQVFSSASSSSFLSQIETSPSQLSIEAPSSFGRINLKIIENLNYKQKLRKGSSAYKLFNEPAEIAKKNFNTLVSKGDESLDQGQLDEAEKFFAKALKAISGNDDIQEAICAKKLGMTYLKRANPGGLVEDKKEECMKAAGLLNYGLLLATKKSQIELHQEIREKLAVVEQVLCSFCNPQFVKDKGPYFDEKNRQRLDEIRNSNKDKLKNINRDPQEVEKLFKEITSEMKVFVASLIEQSIEVLGNPPGNCEFAVIGFGSMAREEMTPFSDLEFAILIEEGKDTDKVKEYFRNLTYFVHLRVLNLGETIVPALGIKALDGFYDGITPRGLAFDGKGCIDKGHKTPLGKKGVFELIQTPTKMASFQGKNGDQYWYEQEPFLPTELHTVTHIYGKNKLVENFNEHLDLALSKDSGKNCSLRSFYAKKHLFEEDVLAFGADFGPTEHGMLFELKKDLYRMPHIFIERFFLNEYESIIKDGSIAGTFSRIRWLLGEKKISDGGANNLKELFGKILLSRLENCYATNSAKSIKDPLITPSEDIDERVCNISFSFCQALQGYFNGENFLHNHDFFLTNDNYLLGQIKARLGKYEEVNRHALECLKQHPSHVDALMLLATMSMRSGDKVAARNDLDQATQIIESLKDDEIAVKIHYFSGIGVMYQRIGEIFTASEIIEKAEKLIEDDPQSAQSYINNFENLATFYIREKKHIKSKEFLDENEKALIRMKTQTSPHHYTRALAAYYYNRSQFLLLLHKVSESIEYAEKSLAMFYEIYGKKHDDTLEMLKGLGHEYCLKGAHEKGLQYLQEALKSSIEVYGEFHATTVERYLALSYTLNKIDPLKGIVSSDYLEKAEKVKTLNISIYYFISSAWRRIDRPDKAEQNLLRAVKIAKEQRSPQDLAICFNNFATLYMDLGRAADAARYDELALEENRKVYGNSPSPHVIKSLTNLARVKTHLLSRSSVHDLNIQNTVIKHFEEAEIMCLEIDKTDNAEELLADVSYWRGYFEWEIMKSSEKALENFLNSLKKFEKLYGNESIHLIPNLEFLSRVYFESPEKGKEFLSYFMRYLDLHEKHYGKSSPKYEAASCLFIRKH